LLTDNLTLLVSPNQTKYRGIKIPTVAGSEGGFWGLSESLPFRLSGNRLHPPLLILLPSLLSYTLEFPPPFYQSLVSQPSLLVALSSSGGSSVVAKLVETTLKDPTPRPLPPTTPSPPSLLSSVVPSPVAPTTLPLSTQQQLPSEDGSMAVRGTGTRSRRTRATSFAAVVQESRWNSTTRSRRVTQIPLVPWNGEEAGHHYQESRRCSLQPTEGIPTDKEEQRPRRTPSETSLRRRRSGSPLILRQQTQEHQERTGISRRLMRREEEVIQGTREEERRPGLDRLLEREVQGGR